MTITKNPPSPRSRVLPLLVVLLTGLMARSLATPPLPPPPNTSESVIASSLSTSDLFKLESGTTILKQNAASPWPAMVVYRKVEASPEKVMSLFRDYENAPLFAKSLKSAQIVASTTDGTEKVVRYEAKIPFLPSIMYVVRNTESSSPLRVSWERVESGLFSEIRGELMVEPFGTGSLIRYTSVVQPASKLAYPFGGAIPRQAQEIVENFSREAEKLAKLKK